MNIRIMGTLHASFNNGPGCRYVVFLQGCEHYCDGCQNPGSWKMDGGELWSVEELGEKICRELIYHHGYDGITLSGGDPYYQEQACIELIRYIQHRMYDHVNVCVYTGYTFDEVKDRDLTHAIDILIDGPYIKDLPPAAYVGSNNQKIIYLKTESKETF